MAFDIIRHRIHVYNCIRFVGSASNFTILVNVAVHMHLWCSRCISQQWLIWPRSEFPTVIYRRYDDRARSGRFNSSTIKYSYNSFFSV